MVKNPKIWIPWGEFLTCASNNTCSKFMVLRWGEPLKKDAHELKVSMNIVANSWKQAE